MVKANIIISENPDSFDRAKKVQFYTHSNGQMVSVVKDLLQGGNQSDWKFNRMLDYIESAKRESGNYRYTPDIQDSLHKDINLLYIVDLANKEVKVYTVMPYTFKPTVEYVKENPSKINVFTPAYFNM